MTVKRIVANVASDQLSAAHAFYADILGMEPIMDHGWIITYGGEGSHRPQISFASEGRSGTAVPHLSIEVDNLDDILARLDKAGTPLEYGPAVEPWGVRRFFVRDPFGKLVNVLEHLNSN